MEKRGGNNYNNKLSIVDCRVVTQQKEIITQQHNEKPCSALVLKFQITPGIEISIALLHNQLTNSEEASVITPVSLPASQAK